MVICAAVPEGNGDMTQHRSSITPREHPVNRSLRGDVTSEVTSSIAGDVTCRAHLTSFIDHGILCRITGNTI